MDIVNYNSQAWDKQVDNKNQWTLQVTTEVIEQAKKGDWQIVLTPTQPVPKKWFGNVSDKNILCLASGGGQQVPILAAAGANVTSFDNSPKQLATDKAVADRDGLSIKTCQGDMADLSVFASEGFDIIFNPCSIGFSPDPRKVWQECFRVLKPGGRLMTGLINPVFFLFDDEKLQKGELLVRYSIPYSDSDSLDPMTRQKFIEKGEPFSFGHTLNDLIGGQLEAGFKLTGMYEDGCGDGEYACVDKYINCFIATLAEK